VGATNRPRLEVLIEARNDALPWIPLAKLFADDNLFDKEETEQLAYAEAWLLVHYLLMTAAKLPNFRAYCAGIPPAGGPGRRLKYAETQLGSLKKLDEDVRGYARRFRKR
jgi:hypothetical protein